MCRHENFLSLNTNLPEEEYKDKREKIQETLQERKRRLKKCILEDLRYELEALGLKVCKEKGRKKYRKRLMKELRIAHLERSRRALEVKKKVHIEIMEKEDMIDMVGEEMKGEMDGQRGERRDDKEWHEKEKEDGGGRKTAKLNLHRR